MHDEHMQGIVCSGVAYYVQGIVSKERGPVFVTAFNPLCMIITAIMGSIILKEEITRGRYEINVQSTYVDDNIYSLHNYIYNISRYFHKDTCTTNIISCTKKIQDYIVVLIMPPASPFVASV